MTPEEKEHILRVFKKHDADIRIGIHLTDDDRGKRFQLFCGELKSLVPDIRIVNEEHGGDLPSINIADNVHYQALPLDKELKPFLDFIAETETEPSHGIVLNQELFDQVRIPAKLTVFISPQCPFCPQTVSSVLILARHCQKIHVTVVDGLLFPEAVQAEKVRSVPTVVLDNRFRWTGTVDLEEIIKIIVSRDPSQLGVDSLQQMIEEGKVKELSDMMADSEMIYPAFMDLLTHSKWAVRLGAMVVFEYLNETSESLAFQILDGLWDRFEPVAEDIKGDILYLFGESKRPAMIERLVKVQDGSYSDDVREAAQEALGVFSESAEKS